MKDNHVAGQLLH